MKKLIFIIIINSMFISANFLLSILSSGLNYYDDEYISKFTDGEGFIHLPNFKYLRFSYKSFKIHWFIWNALTIIITLAFNIGWVVANYCILFL